MNKSEVVDVEIFGAGNLEVVLDNFKHGHYISFVRNVLGKNVAMIEDHEIKKRLFSNQDKELLEGERTEEIIFQLEDNSVIRINPIRLESKIRFEFVANGEDEIEAQRNLVALRETVLNYIKY